MNEKLIARFVELKLEWPVSGMAAKDPETGVVWRRTKSAWHLDDGYAPVPWAVMYASSVGTRDARPSSQPAQAAWDSIERALLSGPYMEDSSTVTLLLGLLPKRSVSISSDDSGWRVSYDENCDTWVHDSGLTKADAVIAAVVEHLERNKIT